MRKFNWKSKSLVITILVLLLLVSNPELRAFLFVLDFLGADLLLLLLGGYLRQYWSIVVFHLRPLFGLVTSGASSIFKSLRWMAYGLDPREGKWAQIDHIVILVTVTTRIALGRRGT